MTDKEEGSCHINSSFEPEEDKEVSESPTTEDQEETKNNLELLYGLEEVPRWYTCMILGLQHCLLATGGLIAVPLILAPELCMEDNDAGYLARSLVLSTLFFCSGILTFLQTTFGSRLPILQGGSFAFLPPTLAILALPRNQCPGGPINPNETSGTPMYNDTDGTIVDGTELWQRRMREVQGAIAVASIAEFVLAITGAIGFLMRFLGPLTVGPSIALVGLSLFDSASYNASAQWGVAIFTTAILIICSQYLKDIQVPFLFYNSSKGCHVSKTNFFKIFPVLITITLSWILCLILTATDALPDDPEEPGYRARTDVKINVLNDAPWFRFPYPGQWGLPVVSGAGVVGMLAAVLAGIVESIGDYYACARMTGAPPLPKHAVNRGLTIEGFGCILAGLLGAGTGTTSYSENIGAIGITRVGSRWVLQIAGILLFVLGMFGKFGAVLVLIPDPVLGGLFLVLFGMIAAVGISNLQHVDLNSVRNLFIIGFSLFMGITIPIWVKDNPQAINTGVEELDQIFLVLLQTSIFVGAVLAAFLDNTIPGTLEERGMLTWNVDFQDDNQEIDEEKLAKQLKAYDLPFSTNFKYAKYIPILPEFGKIEGTRL